MLNISISTVVIDGIAFQRGLEILAEAGAKAIEPAYISGYMPFDEDTFSAANGKALAALADIVGLKINAVSAHMDLGQPDSSQKLISRLEFVIAAGAKILVTNATSAANLRTFESTVEKSINSFETADAVLAIENPGHGQGALLPDGRNAAKIVAAFDHPNLRLNYDAGNAVTYGACKTSPLADLESALPYSAHVHVKDIRQSGDDWEFCPIGDGFVGYEKSFITAIGEANIPIGIEHPIRLWRPRRGDPVRKERVPKRDDILAAVRKSIRFVEAMFAPSGYNSI